MQYSNSLGGGGDQIIGFNDIFIYLFIHELTHIVKYTPANSKTQYHDVTLL